MKSILCFLAIAVPLIGACQKEWKQILSSSEKYYFDKKNGVVEYTYRLKPVLKEHTDTTTGFLKYNKAKEKVGQLSFSDNEDIILFKEEKSFFVHTGKASYYSRSGKENKSDNRLSFLPHWNPELYFKSYHYIGIFHKVFVTEYDGAYHLKFSNNKDLTAELVIDKNSYRLLQSSEVIIHPKYGAQVKQYFFDEKGDFENPKEVLDDLEMVLTEYINVADKKEGQRQEKINQELKGKLIGAKIDMTKMQVFLNGHVEYGNQYILLDFFYQGCLPCIKAIPELNRLRASLASSKLLVIGVDPMDSDAGYKDKFIARYNISYPIIDGKAAKGIRVLTLENLHFPYPTMVLITPDGTINRIIEGYSTNDIKDIRKVL